MCGGLESGNATNDTVKGVVRLVLKDGKTVWLSQSSLMKLSGLLPDEMQAHFIKEDRIVAEKWLSRPSPQR